MEFLEEHVLKHFLLNHPRRKKFPPIPNKYLAYIVGVILGDGNVGPYLVRLRTTTLIFNKSFEQALKNIGINAKTVYTSSREKWNTYVCSVEFATWFKSLTLKKVEKIVTRSKENVIEFLRGFYESEGSAKRWYKVVYVEMSNSNRKLIEFVGKLVKYLGFNFSVYKRYDKRYNSYMYILAVLGSSREKIKFLRLIQPSIKKEPKQYPLKTHL